MFAGGNSRALDLGPDVWEIGRWGKSGKGTFLRIPAGSSTIMEILGLKSGSMLFARQGGFGLISLEAKAKRLQGLGVLALQTGLFSKLRVSADGATVQIDSLEPRHSYRFALTQRRIDTDPPTDASLTAPVTQAPGLEITQWPFYSSRNAGQAGPPRKGNKSRHGSRQAAVRAWDRKFCAVD